MALSDNSLVDLATRLGSDRIQRDAPEGSPWGSSAAPVVFAESEEEVQAVMRCVRGNGDRDRPRGKGGYAGYGNRVDGEFVILSLERMNGILEHSVGD